MKKVLLILNICLAISISTAKADTLTLESVIRSAIEESALYELEGNYGEMVRLQDAYAKSYNYPQLFVSGQYTYQSDVVTFPENPMFSYPEIPKNQGRAAIEIAQVIYNGGKTKSIADVERQQVRAEEIKLHVDYDEIKKGATRMYYGVLMAREKLKMLEQTLEEFQRQRRTFASRVENGVGLPGDLYRFDLMIIQRKSEIIEAKATKNVTEALLSDITGMDIASAQLLEADFTWPEVNLKSNDLLYMDQLTAVMDERIRGLNATNKPQLSAFLQGGVGQPNPFNFMNTDWDLFYIGGIKFRWEIFDFNRNKYNKELLHIKKMELHQRRSFLESSKSRELMSKRADLDQKKAQLSLDREGVQLQESICRLAETQYEEGVLTASLYLDEINKLNNMKIMVGLRELQLNQLIVEANLIAGTEL